MNDDQMDELLIQGARDYNAPGAVPREEMWQRIRAERAAAKRDARGGRRTWVWISASAAAAVVLTAGILIGRRLERTTPPAPSVALVPGIVTPRQEVPSVKPESLVPRLREETRKTGQRVQSLAAADPRAEQPSLAYHLVMLQHLAGSEAMITAFRASARRGEVDAQIAAWSKELLATTRMLEASPVTQDPTMKRLLDDLDLVIVQITQYVTRGTTNPDDLDLIEQSINKRGVIAKLRSNALPARTSPAGT